jgi:hypothetical protein
MFLKITAAGNTKPLSETGCLENDNQSLVSYANIKAKLAESCHASDGWLTVSHLLRIIYITGKAFSMHSMKAYGGVAVQAPLFLISTADGGKWLVSLNPLKTKHICFI